MTNSAKWDFVHFNDNLEEIRRSWSSQGISAEHKWTRLAPNEPSDSSPFDVSDQNGIRGKAKPGHLDASVSRAAHEKIIADLAFLLDLPVPPVILYELSGDIQDCPRKNVPGDKHICVSAWAFESCDQWLVHQRNFTEAQVGSAVGVCSAMWVFDSWVSAEDRNGPKHIVVDTARMNDFLRLAFIDYAFSLSRTWERSGGNDIGPARWEMPMDASKKDNKIVESAVKKISLLQDDQIAEIVNRIPAGWLPTDRASAILNGLLKRKGNISDIINQAA